MIGVVDGGALCPTPPKLVSEPFRRALRGDRNDDVREAVHMLAKKCLGASAVLLPALALPCADRALDPELVVVQEFLEEMERLVEFARPDESVQPGRRFPSPPKFLRESPSNDVFESGRLRHTP